MEESQTKSMNTENEEHETEGGGVQIEMSETVYEELFTFANSTNEVVKKESLKIILSLLEENELLQFITKNSKKCCKILISSLSSHCKILTLECLLNLSVHIPKELVERNIIEILFDMIKEEEKKEEKDEENYIDIYIMILSNLTRCKEGIYKMLDIDGESDGSGGSGESSGNGGSGGSGGRNKTPVSYYLNKLLYFYFLPIKSSINKNINDKYIYVSYILINLSSVKESINFFKSVKFLNTLSLNLLSIDRLRFILPFLINLCLYDYIYDYMFDNDCILFPNILSYVYTNNNFLLRNNNEMYSTAIASFEDEKKYIHHIVLEKATLLVNCPTIKSRILIILLCLSKKDNSR
ncbi:conserved Plasmodium protein, unknown function [Plasmodium ovale wallikeri]|uniref:Protein HGH1 N-terminal domain-containing protein n=1 Tax=Plasmodium ovale wallikeri TaxID=864142 RepID=A0A1A8ZPX2_PLAOA|nr:conserved Plasmodium protein, unknown function [Plasmodium ovale wallikeri]SBT45931.1 conserved Plasmodium protein, unknown function [Plasmodium ovale wallikeri]